MDRIMMRIIVIGLLATVIASAQTFRAGAATSNITPPLGSPIVGNWDDPPATYVHDELHARALVLDDGQTKLVFVISDNVGISRDVYEAAKRAIQEKTGIPREHMMMSSTHTHSGASARSRPSKTAAPLTAYQSFVASRITDAALNAVHNLQPARVGWGRGEEASEVFNRRWRMKPGEELRNPFGGMDQVRMNPPTRHPNLIEPAGPTDPQINFLSVQSADGRPIALLANYSLHYVGGVPMGEISADYFAVFAERIGELLGATKQFVGIMSNGTSGNINNIDFKGERAKVKPYEKMRTVANLVAAEVFKAYQKVEHKPWVSLAAMQTELPLRMRVPTAKDVDWAESVLKKPEGQHVRAVTYARRTLDMRDYPDEIAFPLQAFRIGDLGIASIPAEAFVEIGLEIRKRSALPQTFTISLANGAYGYLPTVEQHKLGGYETWRGTNLVEIEAAPKIVNALVELLAKVKTK
jgi:hypothetical protein